MGSQSWSPWIVVGFFLALSVATLAAWRRSRNQSLGLASGVLLVAAVVLGVLAALTARSARTGPLFAACIAGDARAAETALGIGADVNARNHEGLTPLMLAARGDRPSQNN